MKQSYFTSPGFTFRLQPFGATTALFLLFFLLNFSFGFGQDTETVSPTYDWLDGVDLANFSALDENETGKTIISLAVDSQGFMYTLSFGNGVDKLNPDGSLNQSQFISSNQLQSPLDIEVNSDGTIYIVDYFESGSCLDNGKVKVFNSNGNFQEEIAYSYFRPLGLAIDSNDNIYVAEYYDGSTCESGEESRVRVFNKTGNFLKQTYNVEIPYRLAVDSNNNLYVSQAGDDNPQVLFFNENLNFQGSLSNIQSPGSIVIDDFDFIHVIEYVGRVDFEEFLNYEEISNFFELIALISGIQQGISNDEFGIKIFNSNRVFQYYFQDEEYIEFPVDLAINSSVCEARMYVNNANISGTNLDFDLEIFERTPSFDPEDPLAVCKSDLEFTLENGEVAITAEQIDGGSTDNCEIAELVLSRYTFDEARDYDIELTVTDAAGNTDTCPITITILPEDEDLFIDCPPDQIENLQDNCEFELPDYIGDANFTSGANVTQFPEAGTFITENTEITLTAELDGETEECTFTVETTNQRPDLTIFCSGDQTETADENDVFEIPDYTDLANVENSCGAINVTQSPIAGTEVEENTTVTLSVSDDRGVSVDCSFEVILNFQDDLFINCPADQIADLQDNCEFELPDYIGDANFTPETNVTQFPEAGTFITENTEITLTAELDGETEECTFTVETTNQRPDLAISCPNDQLESFDPDTGFEVPNYENMAGISVNCGEVSFRQEPAAGEIIYNNTTVNLFVEDEGGLDSSCSFELDLTESDVLNITCQIDKNVSPDDNCSFWLPDYTGTAEVNFPGAEITQTPPAGTILTESTQIQLTANLDGETDDCYFMVNLEDDEAPVANCVTGYVVNLDNNGTATITPEDLDDNSTDNCGIVSMALSQTEFTTSDIGDVPVTLTVRDDAGNIDSCETTVEVRDEASGEFECLENIEVFLDENGESNLNLQDLYTGDTSGINLEASGLNFTCEDVGTAIIQLDYSGDQTGSCMINVDVRDELPPQITTNLVELTLNPEGFDYLEETDILAEDNCSEELIYRFSKSVFTCKDVGMNSINVEVEDVNGNRTDQNIQVRISGESCDFPDPGEIEYLFLYPNPNNGIFTIATPEGMFIEQVKVFDSRGRYIMQQDYNANARFYRMTIHGVEESVYTLQIFTNEGVLVKRAIIKR